MEYKITQNKENKVQNYETADMTYFQEKAFASFLGENFSNAYIVKKSGRDGEYKASFEISEVAPDELEKVEEFEKILLSGRPLTEIKETQTKSLAEEYLSAIREELVGSGEEELGVLKDIAETNSPNDIHLHRFKSSDYVEEMADELQYELQWMVTTFKDTQLTDLRDGSAEKHSVYQAKLKLFNMDSDDRYETFMEGLQQFAKERITWKYGYDLAYKNSAGVTVVSNKNIYNRDTRTNQVVAHLKGEEGIELFVDDLGEHNIAMIKKYNNETIFMNKISSGNYVCVTRASHEDPWVERESGLAFDSNEEYVFIHKKHESALRHYLNGQTHEIGINGTPIHGDFIACYREDTPYAVMEFNKKSDKEIALEKFPDVNTVNVVYVDNDGFANVYSFPDDEAGNAMAEKEFLLKMKNLTGLSITDQEEIDDWLDNPFYNRNGVILQITHSQPSLQKERLINEFLVEKTLKSNQMAKETNENIKTESTKPKP